MQQAQQTIKQMVESLVYLKEGRQHIQLGNSRLDFKKEYLYLGMSKSGQVILGDYRTKVIEGTVTLEVRKKYGKIYDNKIHAEGCSFIESLDNWGRN